MKTGDDVQERDEHGVGERASENDERGAMSLLKLSHTPVEHDVYKAMLAETRSADTRVGSFSVRRLMMLTGLNSYSTIRRGREGLVSKLSIDRHSVAGESGDGTSGTVYMLFTPEEIFERRQRSGHETIPEEFKRYAEHPGFAGAIERVAHRHDISRREAQVALCCADGMSNFEIGNKLSISEQTVKFHLRHIFIKFKVKRRSELISRLLLQGGS